MVEHVDTKLNPLELTKAESPLPAGRASVIVNPSLTTLVDQKVDIIVSNLSPEQNITLQARTVDDSNVVFESLAYYMANKCGEVQYWCCHSRPFEEHTQA